MPLPKVIGASELKDYELVFRGSRHGAVATIEPCEGSAVQLYYGALSLMMKDTVTDMKDIQVFMHKAGVNVTIGNHKTSAMVL